MLTQSPILSLDLLLVITVPHFKGGLALANILPSTGSAGSQIYHKTAGTIQLLSDLVCFPCIGASEGVPLLDYWAGNPAFPALSATRVLSSWLQCFSLGNNPFKVFWLAVAYLNVVPKSFCFPILDKTFFGLPQPLIEGGFPLLWVKINLTLSSLTLFFFLCW